MKHLWGRDLQELQHSWGVSSQYNGPVHLYDMRFIWFIGILLELNKVDGLNVSEFAGNRGQEFDLATAAVIVAGPGSMFAKDKSDMQA